MFTDFFTRLVNNLTTFSSTVINNFQSTIGKTKITMVTEMMLIIDDLTISQLAKLAPKIFINNKPCLIVDEDLWCQLCELTNREVVNDEHHFSNHCNFCFTDGRLKIIDYGGTKCREIVNQFGEKISEHFNPLYKY